MAIRPFITLLLIIATVLLAITTIFNNSPSKESKVMPDITFINSTMYDINSKEVTQVIESKKAFHYKTKDEIYEATVIVKSNTDINESITDTVTAKFIEVTPKLFKFRGDVRYNRGATTTLASEALDYDRITQNLIGNKKFIAYHNGSKLIGTSLSIQKDKTIFKSNDNTPVKLDIIMDKKKDKNATY